MFRVFQISGNNNRIFVEIHRTHGISVENLFKFFQKLFELRQKGFWIQEKIYQISGKLKI